MKEKRREDAPPKKPYVKPELKQVPLRPDEAVLGACKVSGGGGPASTCQIGLCFDTGS
jgi:hypothetical protein